MKSVDRELCDLELARADRRVAVGLYGLAPYRRGDTCACGARSLVGPVCRDCSIKVQRQPEPALPSLRDVRRGRKPGWGR